jgi:hypothetical protein
VLLVNGKSVATGARIGRIVVAPTGSRWAAIVIRKNDKHQDVNALIVDGKEVSAGEHAQEIWFSPDGKHYAVACRHFHGRGPDNMVIDGKRSIDYRNLPPSPPAWSPDSSTIIYSATTADNAPVIVAVTNGLTKGFRVCDRRSRRAVEAIDAPHRRDQIVKDTAGHRGAIHPRWYGVRTRGHGDEYKGQEKSVRPGPVHHDRLLRGQKKRVQQHGITNRVFESARVSAATAVARAPCLAHAAGRGGRPQRRAGHGAVGE